MPENAKKRTKITVLSMDVEHQGKSKKAPYAEFTIYNVVALDEAGIPIQERLRTFDGELPKNTLIEVEVEKRPDDRHGTTFTVSIPGKRTGGGLKESVDALREQLEALAARVYALENPGLKSAATPPPSGGGSDPTF